MPKNTYEAYLPTGWKNLKSIISANDWVWISTIGKMLKMALYCIFSIANFLEKSIVLNILNRIKFEDMKGRIINLINS